MAGICLKDLKAGDHILVSTSNPLAVYSGRVKSLPEPGKNGFLYLTPDGKTPDGKDHMSVGFQIDAAPNAERFRTWKITEDPKLVREIRDAITQIAIKNNVPEVLEDKISEFCGRKGGRHRKTHRTRKTRKTRRSRTRS
jgi:hypothetical protein